MKSRAFCIAFAWVFLLNTTSLFAQDAAGAKGKNQRGGLSRWLTSVVDVSYERGILYSDYRLGHTAALHTQLDGFRVQYSLFPHFAKEGGDWLACMLPSRNIPVEQKMTPQVSRLSRVFMED